mmetsp:Transcript_72284/g.131929  ORF Transcript_72284/g.131929 Transcript_72284/m.131929 type:complete len:203 (+) Transcript_72284:104-712(+)
MVPWRPHYACCTFQISGAHAFNSFDHRACCEQTCLSALWTGKHCGVLLFCHTCGLLLRKVLEAQHCIHVLGCMLQFQLLSRGRSAMPSYAASDEAFNLEALVDVHQSKRLLDMRFLLPSLGIEASMLTHAGIVPESYLVPLCFEPCLSGVGGCQICIRLRLSSSFGSCMFLSSLQTCSYLSRLRLLGCKLCFQIGISPFCFC